MSLRVGDKVLVAFKSYFLEYLEEASSLLCVSYCYS